MNERIKKLRKALGLTQQEFGDRIGVKRNTIATYEIGRNVPLDAVITLICREFSVNEAWLRTGEGKMLVEKTDDALEELVKKHHLSNGDKLLIEKFLALKDSERQVVMRFLASIATDYSALPMESPAPEPTMAEVMARLAELERSNTELQRQLAVATGGAVDDADDELDEDDKALADKARKLVLEQRRSEERPESSASYANGLGAG